MKIHKGDNVKIISGNDKGKSGKVLTVLPTRSSVIIENLNMKKKHVRPARQGQKGELVRIPAPLRMSRVMVVCGSCAKPTRIGYSMDGSGAKQRACKKCKARI